MWTLVLDTGQECRCMYALLVSGKQSPYATQAQGERMNKYDLVLLALFVLFIPPVVVCTLHLIYLLDAALR